MPVDINFKAFKLEEFDKIKQISLLNKVRDLEEEVIFEDLFKKWTLPVDTLFESNSITHYLRHKVNSNIEINENKPLYENVPIYFYCEIRKTHLVSAVEANNILNNLDEKLDNLLDIHYPYEKNEIKKISNLLTNSILNYANDVQENKRELSTLKELLNNALEDWNIGLRTAYIHNYAQYIEEYIKNNNILFSENGDIIEPKPYYEIINENKLGM